MIRLRDVDDDITFYEDYLGRVRRELGNAKKQEFESLKLYAFWHRDKYQYYIKQNGIDNAKTYIRRKELKKAKALAQIEYLEKLEKALMKKLMELKRFRNQTIENPFICVEKSMNAGKVELVSPVYISDELYIAEWLEQKYEKMGFKEGAPEFYSRQGLRLRSKSEVIIADMLDEMKVPFLYEKPLKLKYGIVHPDFTILNITNRQEIYWEHLGMMDDSDYRNNAFSKIRNYEESGIYQHDRLIWTFETGKYPLNTRELRKMIKKFGSQLGNNKER